MPGRGLLTGHACHMLTLAAINASSAPYDEPTPSLLPAHMLTALQNVLRGLKAHWCAVREHHQRVARMRTMRQQFRLQPWLLPSIPPAAASQLLNGGKSTGGQ